MFDFMDYNICFILYRNCFSISLYKICLNIRASLFLDNSIYIGTISWSLLLILCNSSYEEHVLPNPAAASITTNKGLSFVWKTILTTWSTTESPFSSLQMWNIRYRHILQNYTHSVCIHIWLIPAMLIFVYLRILYTGG